MATASFVFRLPIFAPALRQPENPFPFAGLFRIRKRKTAFSGCRCLACLQPATPLRYYSPAFGCPSCHTRLARSIWF